MTADSKSVLLASVAVVCWATVATAFKIALSHLPVFDMLFVASSTALVIFSIMMTVEKKWGSLRCIQPKTLVFAALLGVLNPVAYYLMLFRAYDLLPAQVAQPLNYAWPIMLLVLMAVFGHKRIPVKKFIGMALSIGGVVCISLGGGGLNGSVSAGGVVLALTSASLWAAYWLLNNILKDKIDTTVTLFLGFLTGTVVLAAAGCVVGFELSSQAGVLSGIYIGCFEMGIPFIAFGMALRITRNPALINQMCYLSPFLSLFLIAAVLGERVVASTYIGLALIVVGLIYNEYFATSQSPSSQDQALRHGR